MVLIGSLSAPPASAAAGSPGVPAPLRQHNTDGWWYQLTKYRDVQKSLDGAGVTVAMLDSSIDMSAQELQGADVSLQKSCDGTKKTRSTSGALNFHGTAMAALIVGQGHGNGPGGSGILGLAPKARLLFYGMDQNLTKPGINCFDIYWADRIREAVDDGADIITTSTGTTSYDPIEQEAVDYAVKHNVVVVAASGDTTAGGGVARGPKVQYPAGYPGVVAVNAIDQNAKPWSGNPGVGESDAGPAVPVISAPGVRDNALVWQGGRFDSTGWMTGTSPATAIVAGCLALVKQKYPEATGNQLIQDLIHNTGASSYGWDKKYGFGTASATRMLMQDPTKWPDVNPLLKGPDYAYKTYPDSIYGKTQPAASASPPPATSASVAATPTPSPSGAAGTSSDSAAGGSDGSGGMPVWVWVVIGVVVVGGGATAAAAKNARRKTS